MRNSKSDNFCKDFYIPDYILLPGLAVRNDSHIPACPVIVFINTKSGGQLGGELLVTFSILLNENENEVFNLEEKAPDKVLSELYTTIGTLKSKGYHLAEEIEKRLRIVVAGGDGTVGWLLGVVSDLKLPHPPPIATVPLGTGNNIHCSFGWGKRNPAINRQPVEKLLCQVKDAQIMKLDSWHLIMRMRSPEKGFCDPIAPLELPHSLQAFYCVPETDKLNMEVYETFHGGFWNYFSIGMDAQVSYAFHSERKLQPEKFKNQLNNQATYLKLAWTQAWFCPSLSHPSSRNIGELAKVKVMRRNGQWEELQIPHSIRSIVCLNLPSFSGGLNPWGKPNKKKVINRGLTPQFVDDGLLEIVGFKDAWHGLALLTPNGHGTRLAQAKGIRFEFHKGASDCTFMRIDGEPWKQPLPKDYDTVVIDISHLGQVNMLATPNCRSRSAHSPGSPSIYETEADFSDSLSSKNYGERRKFGAADTFKNKNEI